MTLCPCNSQTDYLACCGRYIDKQETPLTPEALMRSRYTAYTQAKIAYIQNTMQGKPLAGFNAVEAEHWSKQVNWKGLQVIRSYMDAKNKNIGYVEFIASYQEQGKNQTIHELSQFTYYESEGKWYYTQGRHPKNNPKLRKIKISRR